MAESKDDAPKAFISYSWSGPDHEAWVVKLATDLKDNYVAVKLDKWHLREGQSSHAFMESMVTDPSVKKVLLVCDPEYVRKSDSRSGGAGTEAQIVSAQVYASVEQTKFVAIVAQRDKKGNALVPVYYSGRIYIDLSDDLKYSENFEQLLRWIYDEPVLKEPELGRKPAFLSKKDGVSLGTSSKARIAMHATREGKLQWAALTQEYFDTYIENIDRFAIRESETSKDDERLLENLNEFIPYRDEMIDVISELARFQQNEKTTDLIHEFFEKLLCKIEAHDRRGSRSRCMEDTIKFLVHEAFLLCIAILIKHQMFHLTGEMLSRGFYIPQRSRADHPMEFYGRIFNPIDTLAHRQQRLELNRFSLHADILHERATHREVDSQQIMQADFVLYLYGNLGERYSRWWPVTLAHAVERERPFPIFARSQSRGYFERMSAIFQKSGKSAFDDLVKRITAEDRFTTPRFGYYAIDVVNLMGYHHMCKYD